MLHSWRVIDIKNYILNFSNDAPSVTHVLSSISGYKPGAHLQVYDTSVSTHVDTLGEQR